MRRILRYDVPVDDKPHGFDLNGPVLHVDCRKAEKVEFWTVDSGLPPTHVDLIVVGTGHDFPDQWLYVGTALAPGGGLV